MFKKMFLLLMTSLSINTYSMQVDEEEKTPDFTSNLYNPASLKILTLRKVAKLNDIEFKKVPFELIEQVLEYKDLNKLYAILEEYKNQEFYKPYFASILAQCLQDKYQSGSSVFDGQDMANLFHIASLHLLPFAAAAIITHFDHHCSDEPNEYLNFIILLIQLINLRKIIDLDFNSSVKNSMLQTQEYIYEKIESSKISITQITPNACGNFNITPFILAVKLQADLDILEMLLNKGANINDEDLVNRNALHYVLFQNLITTTKLNWLLNKKIELKNDPSGLHPLYLALAFTKSSYAAKLILEDIHPKLRPKICSKTLSQLLRCRDINMLGVEFLLDNKAPINSNTIQLSIKRFTAYQEIFFAILKQILDPKLLDYAKICSSVLKGNTQQQNCFKALVLKNQHLLNKHDERGSTLLSAMCKTHQSTTKACDLIEFLIDHGHLVDLQDSRNGKTALMVACKKGHIGIVQILLNHNAQPKLQRTYDAQSPLFNSPNSTAQGIALKKYINKQNQKFKEILDLLETNSNLFYKLKNLF